MMLSNGWGFCGFHCPSEGLGFPRKQKNEELGKALTETPSKITCNFSFDGVSWCEGFSSFFFPKYNWHFWIPVYLLLVFLSFFNLHTFLCFFLPPCCSFILSFLSVFFPLFIPNLLLHFPVLLQFKITMSWTVPISPGKSQLLVKAKLCSWSNVEITSDLRCA